MSIVITEGGSVQVSLKGAVISFTDPTNTQAPIYKVIPTLLQTMSSCIFGQSTLSAGLTAVTLPITPTQLLYAKYLGTTGTITFTWAPTEAGSVEVMVLQPGGVIFFFNPADGISSLSVNASVANTPVDYVLAG